MFIHTLVVLYGFFGFLSPKKYLIFHALFWPLMLIHWNTNGNKCILSDLENKVDNTYANEEWPFMRKFFGPAMSDKMIGYLTYTLYTISWALTLLRLSGRL